MLTIMTNIFSISKQNSVAIVTSSFGKRWNGLKTMGTKWPRHSKERVPDDTYLNGDMNSLALPLPLVKKVKEIRGQYIFWNTCYFDFESNLLLYKNI